jgi:uncharacterized protein
MDHPARAGVLGMGECLALLRTVSIGRLVFTRNALPAIRPVNFALYEDELVLWPPDGLPVGHQEIVAFGADRIDDVGGEGWSVVLLGSLGPELVAVHELPPELRASCAGATGPVLRMHVRHVAGSRLRLSSGVGEPA